VKNVLSLLTIFFKVDPLPVTLSSKPERANQAQRALDREVIYTTLVTFM